MRWVPLLLALTLAQFVFAAPQDDSPAAFVEKARQATSKYQDQSVAILDGYRRIGRDFPAMGEHWIKIGLLFDGKFDAAHPEMLAYATDPESRGSLALLIRCRCFRVSLRRTVLLAGMPGMSTSAHSTTRPSFHSTIPRGMRNTDQGLRCCTHGSGLQTPRARSQRTIGTFPTFGWESPHRRTLRSPPPVPSPWPPAVRNTS